MYYYKYIKELWKAVGGYLNDFSQIIKILLILSDAFFRQFLFLLVENGHLNMPIWGRLKF